MVLEVMQKSKEEDENTPDMMRAKEESIAANREREQEFEKDINEGIAASLAEAEDSREIGPNDSVSQTDGTVDAAGKDAKNEEEKDEEMDWEPQSLHTPDEFVYGTHPNVPSPDRLKEKLDREFGFPKIDLVDADKGAKVSARAEKQRVIRISKAKGLTLTSNECFEIVHMMYMIRRNKEFPPRPSDFENFKQEEDYSWGDERPLLSGALLVKAEEVETFIKELYVEFRDEEGPEQWDKWARQDATQVAKGQGDLHDACLDEVIVLVDKIGNTQYDVSGQVNPTYVKLCMEAAQRNFDIANAWPIGTTTSKMISEIEGGLNKWKGGNGFVEGHPVPWTAHLVEAIPLKDAAMFHVDGDNTAPTLLLHDIKTVNSIELFLRTGQQQYIEGLLAAGQSSSKPSFKFIDTS